LRGYGYAIVSISVVRERASNMIEIVCIAGVKGFILKKSRSFKNSLVLK